MKPKRLVTIGMLTAMYIVLSLVGTLNLGGMKITLDALPIIVGAALFGPVEGMLIGALGSFTNQMLTYGFTATTLLWVLPAALRGIMIGAYAKHRKFEMTGKQTQFITILSSLTVTAVNTAVMYIDAIVYQYSYAYISALIVPRIVAGVITAVVFAALLPHILKPLKKVCFEGRATPQKGEAPKTHCPNCGAPLHKGDTECEYCGCIIE